MAPRDRHINVDDWMYVAIIGSLTLYLVIGIIAWSWMILEGRAVPDSFTTVLSTVAGGLIGVVAPRHRSWRGVADEPDRR